MEMTTVKTWGSKTGALMHIDDCHPELEDAEAIRIDTTKNFNGWIVSEVWAIQLPGGAYVTAETDRRKER